jgi:molecular chaperone GrpE
MSQKHEAADTAAEEMPYEPHVATENTEDPRALLQTIDALRKQLDDVQLRADRNWDMALRAKADGENLAKRLKMDVENAHKFGATKLLEEMIPVLDAFEQAILIENDGANAAVSEGIKLTMKLFLDTLTKNGVQQINPMGQMFNASLHEAISMQPSKEVAANTVTQVFQKGYQLNGRLVRPARVIVAC